MVQTMYINNKRVCKLEHKKYGVTKNFKFLVTGEIIKQDMKLFVRHPLKNRFVSFLKTRRITELDVRRR